jgi:hypothetical protein
MSQAARFNAPSGGIPMARETEHCGQKQMRCAADFCRGLMPTVCANMYTATDLCPLSISRLQRRQNRFSKRPFLKAGSRLIENINTFSCEARPEQVCRKIPAQAHAIGFGESKCALPICRRIAHHDNHEFNRIAPESETASCFVSHSAAGKRSAAGTGCRSLLSHPRKPPRISFGADAAGAAVDISQGRSRTRTDALAVGGS